MKETTKDRYYFLLVVLIAAGFRLVALGSMPLSDFEADWAMQALDVSKNVLGQIGPQPAYVVLTGILFSIFGATNFLARLLPALAGVLLVGTPYFLRGRMGRTVSLIIAVGLAIDPSLIASSRLAGSPMMSVSFTFLSLALIISGYFWWGGILAGLAILSGPSVFVGLIPIGIAWLILRKLGITIFEDRSAASVSKDKKRKNLSNFGYGFVLTFLLVGTGFSLFPQGIGAFADQFPAYLQGWLVKMGMPLPILGLALLAYLPLTVVLSVIHTVRAWLTKTKTGMGLSIVLAVVLVWVLVYPSRQTLDLLWVAVLFWVLASFEIARYVRVPESLSVSLGLAAVLLVFSVLVWMQLAGMQSNAGQFEALQWRWGLIGVITLLAIFISVMTGLGWSWRVAEFGVMVGVGCSFLFYTLSVSFGVAYTRSNNPNELWNPLPTVDQEEIMIETLGDLSLIQTGRDDSIDIVSLVNAPSIKWSLRDFVNVTYASSLSNVDSPPVVITSEQDGDLQNSEMYRGQDFAWWMFPDWGGMFPPDIASWLVFRDAPVVKEHVIVWGRGDIFLDDTKGILSGDMDNGEIELSPDN